MSHFDEQNAPEENYGLEAVFGTTNPFDDISLKSENIDSIQSGEKRDEEQKQNQNEEKKKISHVNPFASDYEDDDDNDDDGDNDDDNDDSDDVKHKDAEEEEKEGKKKKIETVEKENTSINHDQFDDDNDEKENLLGHGKEVIKTEVFHAIELDEEEQTPKVLTRAEERAKLEEMTQLVSSTQTMEYEEDSDPDEMSFSNASDDENGSKKKKGKIFHKGKGWHMSKKAGQLQHNDSFTKTDPYFGLNDEDFDEDDEDNSTQDNRSVKKGKESQKMGGPCVTKYRNHLLVAFVIGMFWIAGLIYGMFYLQKSNKELNEKIILIEKKTNATENLIPSVTPSYSPSNITLFPNETGVNVTINNRLVDTNRIQNVSQTDTEDVDLISIAFKVNTSNIIDKNMTFSKSRPPSEVINFINEINDAYSWISTESHCGIQTFPSKHTLVGCLEGNEMVEESRMIRGVSMSLAMDGQMVAIGIQEDQIKVPDLDNSHNSSLNTISPGLVEVFFSRYNVEVYGQKGQWMKKWEIPNTDFIDSFGYAVSLSGDGTRLAVSSPSYQQNAGRVEMFQLVFPNSINNTQNFTENNSQDIYNIEWVPIPLNLTFGTQPGDREGYAIDLSFDGLHLAVGAVGYDRNDGSGSDYGRVRVFEFSGTGTWQRKKGSDLVGRIPGDQFGASVSLSDDGNRIAVGGWNNGTNDIRGPHVAVFEFEATDWIEIMNSDVDSTIFEETSAIENFDSSGHPSVSLSQDGNTLVISLDYQRSDSNGIESWNKVFEYIDEMKAWSQLGSTIMKIKSMNDFSTPNRAVLSGNGKRVMVLTETGAIDEYVWDGSGDWNNTGSIESIGSKNDFFNYSYPVAIALSRDGTHFAFAMVKAIEEMSESTVSMVYNIDVK